MEIILQHGWGLSADHWHLWPREAIRLDRGYFGTPVAAPAKRGPRTLIAHSFGAHLLSDELLESADQLVLVSAFARVYDRKRAKEMLNLEEFYPICWSPDEAPRPRQPNSRLLQGDLEQMLNSRLDLSRFAGALLFHGEEDRVIPPALGRRLCEQIEGSTFHLIPDLGHALPYTHPEVILRCLNR